MNGMFEQCYNLTSLDVSSFNTSNVLNTAYMFYSYGGAEIKGIENFDTSNVYYMKRMFQKCGNLTSLDLCSFDTSKVTNMYAMFASTTNLKHIYVGSKWTTATATTTNMFNRSEVSKVAKGQC